MRDYKEKIGLRLDMTSYFLLGSFEICDEILSLASLFFLLILPSPKYSSSSVIEFKLILFKSPLMDLALGVESPFLLLLALSF